MELKRKLTALGKRMSPQIEVMNVADEIKRCLTRIDELVTYAQTKIDRSEERKKNKELTIGAKAQLAREAADKEVVDAQTEESDANLKDQQEAFDERNKKQNERTGTDAMDSTEETPDAGGEPSQAE